MLHALESRRLLAAAVVNPGPSGVLTVEGTAGSDLIVISRARGDLEINLNGTIQRFATDFSDGEFNAVVINAAAGDDSISLPQTFGNSQIRLITINGQDGDDTVTGSGLDDVIYGNDGNDRLLGRGGNDRLVGGPGHDDLRGMDGQDTIVPGAGTDRISGGDGRDRADYYYERRSVRLSIDGRANDGTLLDNDNILTDMEEVFGGQENDAITGSSRNNVLHGRGGRDVIWGLGGNDTLYGGDDDDKLNGHEGADFLLGGAGSDEMIGGKGNDTVDYSGQVRPVRVILTLEGTTTENGQPFEADTIGEVENAFGGHDDDTLTGSDGPNFLRGLLGNDSLIGAGGRDTLDGDGGVDATDNDPRDILRNIP